MKALANALRFIVFSNIFIAVCVLCFTIKTALLMFHNAGSIHVNVLVFFATLFLYGFHLMYHRSSMTPREHKEERHHWVDEHKYLHIGIVIVSFLISLSQMFYMPLRVWVVLIPVAIISMGYSVPIIKTKHGWIRFRDVAWLKVFWIGLCYAWLTTLLPLAYALGVRQWLNADMLLMFLRNFLFVFAIAIPFDIRDIGFDKERGNKTLPVILGVDRAILLANGLMLCFVVIVLFQCEFFNLNSAVAIALCLSVLISSFAISMAKPNRPNLFFQLAIDSTMVVQFLLVLIAIRYF
ncbi:MAG TPA: UbiA family prenyltransferase [Bacteroidia bacterium]|jgi:4-hydroxybenzoate polyprenyltransferase|nr:UbiA family prenyltransferase [Bacteroidia bacterium]